MLERKKKLACFSIFKTGGFFNTRLMYVYRVRCYIRSNEVDVERDELMGIFLL